jgi:hypothetical protein
MDIRNWEPMSKDEVDSTINKLGTKDIEGRHINCICRRGGKRFHGKIHVIEGNYRLQPMIIKDANKEMISEMGSKKPRRHFSTAWSKPRKAKKAKEPVDAVKKADEKTTRRNVVVHPPEGVWVGQP